MKFAQWAKMYAALAGLLASAALGVTGVPMAWKLPLSLVVAGAGALAVWKVENAPADPPAPAWKSAGPAWDDLGGDEPLFGYVGEYEDDYF